jgi:hypothetical protein
MANKDQDGKIGALLARAHTDGEFRKRLLADPAGVLRAEGIALPPEVKVKVLENSADLLHIVLPAKQEALADETLDQVTAGVGKDPHKPCGNSTCTEEYNSAGCWARWSLSFFGLCKYTNYDKIHPDQG